MNSQGLDARARQRIERNIRAMASYLDKLTGRMHQRMFPADDPLKLAGDDAAHAVTIDGAGNIIVVGESEAQTGSFAVGRLKPNGDFDTSFGSGGRQGFDGAVRGAAAAEGQPDFAPLGRRPMRTPIACSISRARSAQ